MIVIRNLCLIAMQHLIDQSHILFQLPVNNKSMHFLCHLKHMLFALQETGNEANLHVLQHFYITIFKVYLLVAEIKKKKKKRCKVICYHNDLLLPPYDMIVQLLNLASTFQPNDNERVNDMLDLQLV